MEVDLVSWLGMALRWMHVIFGIAWIGSSFYFVWLDNSLVEPADKKDRKAGVGGELWAVHGGGFYHKKKYPVAPKHMPPDLHWFKWEAYFTWFSGFILLALIYYHGAEIFLIDSAKLDIAPWKAILISLGFIAGGWLFYDGLCRSAIGKKPKVFGAIWFLALTAAAWGLTQIFTDRGAFIHVGAIIGTAMAANVFMVIIPNQKIVVADLLAGRTPDPELGARAKQRSMHNNYMTLPVVLIMISSHYPVMYGHDYNWLILAAMSSVVAWPVREFFNLKHKGRVNYAYPAFGVAAFVVVMLAASGLFSERAQQTAQAGVTDAEVKRIINDRCVTCHSDTPTHELYDMAPLGAMFDKMDEIRTKAPLIHAQAVATDVMPPANETGMTEEEREKLGAWIAALGGTETPDAPVEEAAVEDTDTVVVEETQAAEAVAPKPVDGEVVMKRKCRSCHTWDDGGRNLTGPNLHGVFGRDIAALDDFKYSDAILEKQGEWTQEALDQYLRKPKSFVPGGRMNFIGLRNDAERAAVIDFLKSQKD